MQQIIRINDRITWVVADPGQPQTGKGKTPDVSMLIIPTKTEEWILKTINSVWEKTASKIGQIKPPQIEDVSMPIIPTKTEEKILKTTAVLWEKTATKIKQIKPPHIDMEQVGEVLTIVGACLQPLLIFAASVGEVLVGSMLSSICF